MLVKLENICIWLALQKQCQASVPENVFNAQSNKEDVGGERTWIFITDHVPAL